MSRETKNKNAPFLADGSVARKLSAILATFISKFFALGISKTTRSRHHCTVHVDYCIGQLNLEQERYHGCCKFRYTQQNSVVHNASKPQGKSFSFTRRNRGTLTPRTLLLSLSISLPLPLQELKKTLQPCSLIPY